MCVPTCGAYRVFAHACLCLFVHQCVRTCVHIQLCVRFLSVILHKCGCVHVPASGHLSVNVFVCVVIM